MRIALTGLLVLAGCAAAPAPHADITDPAAIARGRAAYQVRCMGCHEPATPGAPDRAKLAAMTQSYIHAALTAGKMKLMTLDLPEQEAREIAAYLAAD